MRTFARLLAAVALAASIAACGGVDSPSNLTAEDFGGVILPGGAANKPFSVSKTGEMQFTLQSLTPRPLVGFLAVGVGQPAGSDCLPFTNYTYYQVAIGQQYSFSQIDKGGYCIVVSDVNAILNGPTTFAIHFVHP